MSPRSVQLVIDTAGRPPTSNQRRREHWRTSQRSAGAWRAAGAWAALEGRVTPFSSVSIEAWGRYPNRRGLPDPDGISPAVKSALDGLVDRGVIEDDRAPYVLALTYRAPVVAPGPPALVLVLTEEHA